MPFIVIDAAKGLNSICFKSTHIQGQQDVDKDENPKGVPAHCSRLGCVVIHHHHMEGKEPERPKVEQKAQTDEAHHDHDQA